MLLVFNKVPSIHSNLAIEEAKIFFDQNNINPDYILNSVIKERVAFKHSIKSGRGVIECSPQDDKATKEIESCANEILVIIKQHYILN
ncbi:hypothetical protein [Candidatus Tisiphia endosymbiont of Ditula angustiorana]|uniref:hypothetical protein n=1 Tax=Candidatus Tisiphia endosymbiont of Ditula angustiorana TaxID=3066272 RepID=UPI00312CADCA